MGKLIAPKMYSFTTISVAKLLTMRAYNGSVGLEKPKAKFPEFLYDTYEGVSKSLCTNAITF